MQIFSIKLDLFCAWMNKFYLSKRFPFYLLPVFPETFELIHLTQSKESTDTTSRRCRILILFGPGWTRILVTIVVSILAQVHVRHDPALIRLWIEVPPRLLVCFSSAFALVVLLSQRFGLVLELDSFAGAATILNVWLMFRNGFVGLPVEFDLFNLL